MRPPLVAKQQTADSRKNDGVPLASAAVCRLLSVVRLVGGFVIRIGCCHCVRCDTATHGKMTGEPQTNLSTERGLSRSGVWQRKQGDYWIYAEKGTPIRFALAVGKSPSKNSIGVLTLPDGQTKEFEIPLGKAKDFEFTLADAPITGVYRLSVAVGSHAAARPESETTAGSATPINRKS